MDPFRGNGTAQLLYPLICFSFLFLGIVVRAAEDEVEGEDERAGSGASQTGADDDDDDDDDTTIEEEKVRNSIF